MEDYVKMNPTPLRTLIQRSVRLGISAAIVLSSFSLIPVGAQQTNSKVRFEISFAGSARNEPTTGPHVCRHQSYA